MKLTKTHQTSYGGTVTDGLTPQGIALICALPFVILLIFMLISTVRAVAVGEVGVVTRFGSVVGEDQSGLHFILPWPIESMTAMNIQTQKMQQSASAATQDLQTVTATVALDYQINPGDVNNLYRKVGVTYANTVVQPIMQQAIKSVTSQYNASDLVDERPQVEQQITTKLSSELAPYGITVNTVSIVDFAFSSQYSNAVEAKQVAQQNVQTQQYNLQAAALQAKAQKSQSTTLSPAYLELQAIQKWNGQLPTTVAGGSNPILNIPLQGN